MITLENIRLNNAQNKTYLKFEDSFTFHDDTIYFIIGLSGVGKTSLVDFMTAPFTDDPIKNGKITLSENIALRTPSGKEIRHLKINNSHNVWYRQYVKFIRKSVAYIPQKTDSFHPTIPVAEQMRNYYSMALPNGKRVDDAEDFNKLLDTLSRFAGWDSIQVDPKDKNALLMTDVKEYLDDSNGDVYDIVKKEKERKYYEDEFSTGQLQRLLILMGLLRFHLSEQPILIGDEYLVNFTYSEANDVLKKIITFFINEQKKHKIAIFILHDLSFEFLQSLSNDYPVRIVAIESDKLYENKIKNETANERKKRLETEILGAKKIVAHEILIGDFFINKWKNDEEQYIFEKFKKSYESIALDKNDCSFNISLSNELFPYKINVGNDPYGGKTYQKIDLDIKKNRFIVLTGFSGCGKSTLCNHYVSTCIRDKKLFRYFPSRSLSSLSVDSQISVRKDLSIMYNYYNRIDSPDKCIEDLESILNDVHLNYSNINDFLDRKIYDLSGGELQRYWLARILFSRKEANEKYIKPELLILDESIASLDCITKNSIIGLLLEEVLSRRGMTILYVSHDLRDINVIYNTLLDNIGNENINNVFEHYEMFSRHIEKDSKQYSNENSSPGENIFRVITPFPKYCDNLINRRQNMYESLKDGRKLNLRLIGKYQEEEKTGGKIDEK